MHNEIARVWRGELVESIHHGSVVWLAADGTVLDSVGQPDELMYPRSTIKPAQGLALLRAGLRLEGELLALACASHSGEEFHQAGARRILASVGLTESALACTPDLPLSETARNSALAQGFSASPIFMNCSGKHAAMLAVCVANGWDLASYLDPTHPLQQLVASTISELAGVDITVTTVDGCGAPLFALPLTGLARVFQAIRQLPEAQPIADAMSTHPEWVDGPGRANAQLMQALPGSVAKVGAEGVLAIALPDGRAIALKVADGALRATTTVMVAALARFGIDLDLDFAEARILGHGKPVGRIEAVLPVSVL